MMLYKLLSGMDRENWTPEVVSLTDRGPVGAKIEDLGVPVLCVGMHNGLPDPISIWRLIKMVRGVHPSLIQGWMYHGNLAAQFVNAFLPKPVPVLWNVRHSVYDLKYEKRTTSWVIRLGAKLSRKPCQILYNSRVSALQHEALGYEPEKQMMIPNGYDTDIFSPSEEARLAVRKELGLSPSSTLIGLIGRYHPMKDHGNFIRAAAQISQTHPDVHFLLAGTNVDADNTKLTDLIKSLDLTSKFHLLGERKDIDRLTASLDIASSSSFTESSSNIIGEAMACGVPCVATDVGDNGWVISNAGRVIPPRDPQAMASALRELLNTGREGRRKLGEKARERIQTNFSIKKIVNQYESLHRKILDGV